jgi:dihydroorotase
MILKNAKVISPKDNINDIIDIRIENGIITEIAKNIDSNGMDYSQMIISPGLIDMHCHLREPGFEYKETIKTGIQSALNGGYTAICPMANTNPTVDSLSVLKYTLNNAQDIGFYPICAITKGLCGEKITDFKTLKQNGAIAFSDDGKPVENFNLLEEALKTGELIISHAEDSKLRTHPISEAVAVARELEILREVGGRIHFAHISTKKAIALIRQAKNEGLNITCETAPHYFSFTQDDETKDGRFKMNPPLRTQEDLKAVIKGLKDNTIDCIATDHAPHSIEEKTTSFEQAPFGIVGFETALSASLKLVLDGHLTIEQMIEKMSVNPAKILGLNHLGQIKIGQRANLTIINPAFTYMLKAEDFKSKCKISPFEGIVFKGKAIGTIVDGKLSDTRKVKSE